MAVATCFLVCGADALAQPQSPSVASGSTSFAQTGSVLNVTTSNGAIINWNTFNIAAGETTRFIQPSASSAVLNRVLGNDPSQIFGTLSSNGRVWLINPNGIMIGKTARIDTAGFIASSLNITDASFLKHVRSSLGSPVTFDATPGAASVINQGTIITPDGGSVFLLGGSTVENHGLIRTPGGETILAAGATVHLLDTALPGINVEIGGNGSTTNLGTILADAGRIGILGAVVRNSGRVSASSVVRDGGRILLKATRLLTLTDSSRLEAESSSGDGGFVETSADVVKIADGARVSTTAPHGKVGTWLIDPTDYTVAASGGDISGAALSANLESTNIELQSSDGAAEGSGDINIEDAVSWIADTTLTMTASNNVNVNATITATGADAGIVISPNTDNGTDVASGKGTFNLGKGATINLPNVSASSSTALIIGGVSFTVINSLGAEDDISAQSLQGMQINPSGRYALGSNIDASTTSAWNGGSGFAPIGSDSANFVGVFDGLGHKITDLTINAPTSNNVGLIGNLGLSGQIRNIGLSGGSVTGGSQVGALVGYNFRGTIKNSYSSADVSGNSSVGGLVGAQLSGNISNAYASGSVTAGAASSNVGGLVGVASGSLRNVYATAAVTAGSGSDSVGGLVGKNYATVRNVYSSGSVSATSSTHVGGLIGDNTFGNVADSFWNVTTSGQATSSGGTGLTSAQMKQMTSFNQWNITNVGNLQKVWRIYEGHSAPLLGSFMPALTLTDAADVTVTYNHAAHGGATTSIGGVLGTSAATGTNVGVYNGYYSTQDGYNIDGGNLLITPAVLSATGTAVASKVYDRTTTAVISGGTLSGTIYGGDDVSLNQSGVFASRNVGMAIAVTVSDSLSGSAATNYELSLATETLSGNITPKALTVTGTVVANKVYDGTTKADVGGGTLSGVIAGDTVKLKQSGVFASKNAGIGVAVAAADSLLGASAGNYSISESGLAANITPKALTISAPHASNKVYDGSTSATLTGGALRGVVGSDGVTLTQSGNFVSKNVGKGKQVNYSNALSGTDAGNYSFTSMGGTTTANITALKLMVGGLSVAANKVFDGTTLASVSGGMIAGAIAGDSLTFAQTGTFANAKAGVAKKVSYKNNLTGTDAANYTLSSKGGNLKANITP